MVGFVTLVVRTQPEMPIRAERRYVELDNIIVALDCRNRGIGTALVRAAEVWARARGITSLELTVHSFNQDARRFYERLGFSVTVQRLARPI